MKEKIEQLEFKLMEFHEEENMLISILEEYESRYEEVKAMQKSLREEYEKLTGEPSNW